MLRSKITRVAAALGSGGIAGMDAIGVAPASTTVSLSGLTFSSGDTLCVFYYDETGSGKAVCTTPSGYTLADSDSSARSTSALFYKTAAGSETTVVLDNIDTTGLTVVIVAVVPSSYSYSSDIIDARAGNMAWKVIGSYAATDISLAFGAYGDIVSAIPAAVDYTLLAQVQNGVTNDGATAMVCYRTGVTGNVQPVNNDGGLSDEYTTFHVRFV